MNTELIRRLTPEERELEKKKAELAVLEAKLAERELDLATLQAELHVFEQRYLRIVGSRYAELDEVKAQIAEARARLNPDDAYAQEEADEARAQADESAHAAAGAEEASAASIKFKPSESLKKLYREAARQIHPDLTTDAEERHRRHQVMIEINRAYEAGDEDRLQALLRDWQRSPESIKDKGIGAELIRLIRKIAQVDERLDAIDVEIEAVQVSELAQLRDKVETAEDEGRDLLQEMADEIEEEIARAKIEGYDVFARLLRKLDRKLR
ncbi:MAG: molecular chaperone DnaJ [Acidobacteria bacterium]|nr:molecular chaperone DnaJ [Acidobacteriota bacterium]